MARRDAVDNGMMAVKKGGRVGGHCHDRGETSTAAEVNGVNASHWGRKTVEQINEIGMEMENWDLNSQGKVLFFCCSMCCPCWRAKQC